MKEAEGYIKFNIDWNKKTVLTNDDLRTLNKYRQLLYRQNLIGCYADDIGFGNISRRMPGTGKFIITGTRTGLKDKLGRKDYSLVEKYSLSANYIRCTGDTEASSEALSHAAAYKAGDQVSAVIHTHHHGLWNKYMHHFPTIPDDHLFGTRELAESLFKLIKRYYPQSKTFVMAGHKNGIISIGSSMFDVYKELMNLIRYS